MTASINASTSSGVVVTSDTSGTLQLQSGGTTIATVSSTGLASTSTAKAWGSYTGTAGAPTLRSAFNISGGVRNSSGNLTFTFTTAMADANYAVITSIPISSAGNTAIATVTAKTTTTFTLVTQYVSSLGGAGAPLDYNIDFVVFGN